MTNERKLEERCTPGNESETCPVGITAWALGTALREQWQSYFGTEGRPLRARYRQQGLLTPPAYDK